MNKKLIIFDMDGTILNTLEDITGAVNFILNKYNMPARSLDEVRFFVGNGLKKTLERSVPAGTDDALVDEMFPIFTKYYKENSNKKTCPYDGIVEAIAGLKEKGYRTAVVSNKRHEAVEKLCYEFFDGCFDIYMGDQEGIKVKPAPDMVYMTLETLGITNEDAVYIGDSDVDLLTAANSNMDFIGVSWGFRGRQFLEEKGAHTIIDVPSELLEVL